MATQGYDFIVVGAGPAGCALAGRLSAKSGARVLLLEAGGPMKNPLWRIPAAVVMTMADPRSNWSYKTEPVAALDGRRLPWLAGKTLGGGSAINGMMFLRGGRYDFDRWRDEAGCPGWGFDDVLPYFLRFENSERGGGPWHGGDGPIGTARGRPLLPLTDLFLEAANQTGLPIVDDLNADAGEGVGYYDSLVDRGLRSSPVDAYLKPGLRAGTLTVLSQAQALKVDFENGQATGVTFLHDGEVRSAHAAQEVILSAGAINSTQLLLLSGIGPAAELEAAGIPVIADSPEVGHNLQNHAAYLMDFACSAPVTAYRYMHPLRGPASALRYAFQRNGILASPPGPAGGLLNVAPGAVAPDVQLILGSGLPDPKRRGLMAGLPSRHGFRFMLNQGRPYSRGRVRLRSASPLDAPLIEPGYFEDPRDLETLRLAMERAREIAAAPALAKVVEAELKPGPAVQGKAAIEAAIRRWGTNHYHPAGTCRMGSDDRAVVDTQLRVRGVERLRIADTAIMPLLVNGNTGASALMIGERAAALMQS